MKLSVLVAAIFLKVVAARRLTEIETNEIDTDPASSSRMAGGDEWVKIDQPPFRFATVGLGSRVELECVASGSPVPVIQWLKGSQPLTEVSNPYGLLKYKDGCLLVDSLGPLQTCIRLNIYYPRFVVLPGKPASFSESD